MGNARRLPAAVAVLGIALGGPAQALAARPVAAKERQAMKTVVDGNAQFGLELYALLAATEKGNLFFSPASIHTALAMTYAGAGGLTAEQMAKTLHFALKADRLSEVFAALLETLNNPWKGPDGKGAYELLVANALWGQKGYPFRQEFIRLLKASYGAGLNQLDFARCEAARGTINGWVAKQTRNKIQDLIPPGAITPIMRLVLTNAIYFKSNWAETFEESATKPGAFHLSPGRQVKAPLMYQKHRFGYMETGEFQALEMPYRFRDLSMVVLLPRKADGLASLEKNLTAGNLAAWLGKIRHEEVKVTFPRFEFASRFSLKKALAALGMTDAFSPDADFSGMATIEKLFISDVIHKAYVAVDEQGTEAAAATGGMFLGAAMPVKEPEPKVFKADHPFLFLIRHRATGAMLFLGRVVNPGK